MAVRNSQLFLPFAILGNFLFGQCPPASTVQAPIVEDFTNETVPIVGTPTGANLSSCWTLYSGSSSAGFRWETEDASGSDENSFATGPFFDATSHGISGGKYLFLEVATGNVIDTAYFISPLIDISLLNSPTLRFSYHMYGAHIGSLLVQIDDGDGWDDVWSLSGQQQSRGSSPWKDAAIDLSGYSDSLIIRFVGVRGAGFRGDIAIDDILLNNNPNALYSLNEIGHIFQSSSQGWNKQFGTDLILSNDGTKMLVSCINEGYDQHHGHMFGQYVRVFSNSGSGWAQMGNSIISGAQIGNSERCSFDLSDDGFRLSIGDPAYNKLGVYEYNNGVWVQMGVDINGFSSDLSFGHKCSLSNNGQRIAVGVFSNNTGTHSGIVRIFEWDGSGWFQMGSDIVGEAIGDHFGASISFADNGDIIAIGAPSNDGNGSSSGHSRVYEWNGLNWIQKGGDIDGEYAGDNSGSCVKLSGNGNRLAIGALKNDGGGTNSGHVRLFEWSNGSWIQVGNDFNGKYANEGFGSSIALSHTGDVMSIGATGSTMNGYHSGQVISYVWFNNSWQEYVAYGDEANDRFGAKVTMDMLGSKLAVSAPYSDNNGQGGIVKIFSIPQTVQSFNPDSAYVNNRACVVCDQYAVGDTFSLDSGATWYTVVDRALLEQKRDTGDDLSKVCVSLVSDMSNLFQNHSTFNDSIASWDVSNVTDMEYMFLEAHAFNQPIGNWDMSSVQNMAYMFKRALAFDQHLNNWDVGSVTTMRQLFFGANNFNGTIDQWEVSNVNNMQGMFQGASVFNQPIGSWNVSNVANMGSMFYNTYAFDQDLSMWCVSNIATLPTNFAGNSALQSIHFPQWGTCPCLASVDLGPDTIAVCGGSYTLDAGSGFSSYVWSTGDSTQTLTVSSSGMYAVTVTANGCTATDSVYVNPLDATITASDSVVCAGESVSLSVANGAGSLQALITQLGQDIDGEAVEDRLGRSVSLSADGQTVAIGAHSNDGNGSNAGHVRIYTFNGSGWSQVGQDIDGEAAGDFSGYSVALSANGQTVAIGANGNDGNGSDAGHVRIYTFNGSGWSQVGQDIDGEAAGDQSGWSTSLSADGQTVAIGANGNDGNGSLAGHVRIYTFNGSGWSQVGQDIDGEAAYDSSGWSVSLSADGQTVAIGATRNDGNGSDAGHVRIYTFNGSGWSQLGQDIDGEASGDQSGYSVSLSADGQTVAIGATGNDGNGRGAGHVRIYTVPASALSNTYLWSTGDTTASITANPTQTTTYYCTVSDGIATCTDSVTVYVNPVPNIDLGPDTISVCGSSYTLDAGSGFSSYLWSTGDSAQTLTVSNSGMYGVTVTANSCSATDSGVFVHFLNTPIVVSDSVICEGTSVNLSARYQSGLIAPAPSISGFTYHGQYDGQYIYASQSTAQWNTARNNCLSHGGDLIVIKDAVENSDYYSIASQYFGNQGSWIGLTDEAQEGTWVWVDGSPLSYANWSAGEPNNFGGAEDYANFTTSGQWNDRGSRNLYYLMAIPIQVSSYAWSTGDSTANITVTPAVTTTYYCTTSDGVGTCTDSVTVYVNPAPSIDLGTDTIAVCGRSYTLDAGAGFDRYQWSTGDTTQSIMVTQSGMTSCTIWLQNCSVTDSVYIVLLETEVVAYRGTITDWQQMGLDIDGEAAGDRFGVNVALSADGSRLAAGAHFNDGNGSFSGHTRIFSWDGSQWNQLGADIDGEAAGDRSGVCVSLSDIGHRIAIGEYQNDGSGSNAGQTRVFEWNGSSWIQLGADINGEAANDWAGWSVSLSGDGTRLAVGAYQNDGNGADAGHTRVYTWNGSQWSQMGTDIDGENAGDGAGVSVSLSTDGSRLAIGAYKDDDGGLDAGSASVYQWDGSSWQKLGVSLIGESAEDYFGWSVDLSSNGNRLAVGAYQNDGNGSNSGQTRIFDWNGSSWQQVGNDIDGEAAGDLSGISVALTSDGQSVAVGAHQNDGSATNAGHARLYRWDGSQWNVVSSDMDGEAAGDLSGHSIALSANGKRLASGARVNAGNGLAAGHVRVYELNTVWDLFSGSAQNQIICSGDSISLEASVQQASGNRFLWSTGDTTSSITIWPTQNTVYSCTVSNGSHTCTDSIYVSIAAPVVDFGPDTIAVCGSSYTLNAGAGFDSYLWNTGGVNPTLIVGRTGLYTCTITLNGCTATDSIYIHLLEVSIAAQSQCVTNGDSTLLTVQTNSASPLTYNWSTGDTAQAIWVMPSQIANYTCTVSDGVISCSASVEVQIGDWQPQASLVDNSYTTRFTWPNRSTARYNLHLREVGQSSWTNYIQTATTKNLRNLLPGDYEFFVTAYNSIVSGVDTSCLGYFTQECADITYSYNVFQAPELGRSGRVRVFGTQGGKRLYDIHLVDGNGDSTSVYNARQSNFTQLNDGRFTVYVVDDIGCPSDSIARFAIEPMDTARVPFLIGAPNNPPNGFRPTWNAVSGVINYQLRVLNITDGTLQDFITGITDTSYAVTNLPTGKLYRFNVRSRYNKATSIVNSGYSNPVSRNLGLNGNKGTEAAIEVEQTSPTVRVYPNPTQDLLYVQAPEGSVLMLIDIHGKEITRRAASRSEEVFDLRELAQGVYLIRVIGEELVHQERIVKQ